MVKIVKRDNLGEVNKAVAHGGSLAECGDHGTVMKPLTVTIKVQGKILTKKIIYCRAVVAPDETVNMPVVQSSCDNRLTTMAAAVPSKLQPVRSTLFKKPAIKKPSFDSFQCSDKDNRTEIVTPNKQNKPSVPSTSSYDNRPAILALPVPGKLSPVPSLLFEKPTIKEPSFQCNDKGVPSTMAVAVPNTQLESPSSFKKASKTMVAKDNRIDIPAPKKSVSSLKKSMAALPKKQNKKQSKPVLSSNINKSSSSFGTETTRGKVREIFVNALSKVAEEVDGRCRTMILDPSKVAMVVESVMFEKLGPFNGANRLKYRSIIFNLRDGNNPDLRRKLVLGQLNPERLVTMTSEEMASDRRQLQNAQIRDRSKH